MFYIRKNTGSKKRIEENVSLEYGIEAIKRYSDNVSLMYTLPNKRGIKVYTNEESNGYTLNINGKTFCNDKNTLKLYTELLNAEFTEGNKNFFSIKNSNTEMAHIQANNIKNVIDNISKPLNKILNSKNIVQEEQNTEIDKSIDTPITKTTDTKDELCVSIDLMAQDMKKNKDIYVNDNKSDNNAVSNNGVLTEIRSIDEKQDKPNRSQNNKYVSYHISGTLRSGTEIKKIGNTIHCFNEARSEYEKAKEKYDKDFTSISLKGTREDGSISTRYSKTFEPSMLSFEKVSELIKLYIDISEFLTIIDNDATNALATEDKKYNAGAHIIGASDLDLDSEFYRSLIIEMKISADKRRDMKSIKQLINNIKPCIKIDEKTREVFMDTINKIEQSQMSGSLRYKDKLISDIVKEVDYEHLLQNYSNINDIETLKTKVRSCAIENTISLYKKHYA